MYAKIVGIGPEREGKNKNGRDFHGQVINLTYQKRGVDGLAVKEQYVSFLDMEKPPKFALNQEVFLDFDDSGYLLEIEIVPPAK